jgi:hypothetical protein
MPQQVLKAKISSTEEFMMGRMNRGISKHPGSRCKERAKRSKEKGKGRTPHG